MHDQPNSSEFEVLCKRNEQRLYKKAYYLTQDSDDAQDLLQDSYLRAYVNFDKFDGTNFVGWMIKIIDRLFINKVNRKKENYIKVDCDSLYNHIPYTPSLEIESYGDDMTRALATLPDNYAYIMKLAYVDGYTYEDISGMVNVKMKTVKTRIHRSKQMLRDRLPATMRPICKRGV